jgi:signal transduction histidine kinase/ActR/RegA family two-component response regulator
MPDAPTPGEANQDLARLRARAERLVRANLALVRQLRPSAIPQWTVNDVRTVVDAEVAALLLTEASAEPDPPPGTFIYSGLAPAEVSRLGALPPEATGILGEAMRAKRSIRLPEVSADRSEASFPTGHPVVRSFLSAPLIRGDEVIGLLYAANKRGAVAAFTDEDERFLATLAAELARSPQLGVEVRMAPDLVDRLSVTSRSLRREMEATRQFLSSLSHELRGAISGILVSAELLGDTSFGSLGEEQVRTLGSRIHVVASNLLALVDNLLDLGRLEAGRLDVRRQPVDLVAVVNDVEKVVIPLAERAGVSVELPPLAGVPRVVADPIRLSQVLVNLFSNAIKFTPVGGRSWLEVEVADGEVRLAVCDTGSGIAAEETERIFEPFERAAAPNIPGVGLGLAISQRIIELHGARLEVASKVGTGSRFSFVLHASREPLPPRLLHDPGVGQVALVGHRPSASILVVEDDPVNRQSISDVLAKAGYRVRAVGSRAAALKAIEASPVDAVTLDVQLPDGNGLEIIDALRAAVDRPLAVIALSADRLGDTAERAIEAGCDHFALKPIPARDLLALLAASLRERSGEDRRSDPPLPQRG